MDLIIILAIGTICMAGVMMYCRRWNHFAYWKTGLLSIILTICGVLGVKILFFIENGNWAGLSFYGAVFFVPVFFIFVCKAINLPYGKVLDVCAPAECIMLVVMKINCIDAGCCRGRVIGVNDQGATVLFPSQLAEMITAIIIMVVLIIMMKNPRNQNRIYAWYMIIYGVTRFILNLFRETEAFIWKLPIGNFWSIIAVAIGIIWIFVVGKRIQLSTECEK